jgi:hypothetical protein
MSQDATAAAAEYQATDLSAFARFCQNCCSLQVNQKLQLVAQGKLIDDTRCITCADHCCCCCCCCCCCMLQVNQKLQLVAQGKLIDDTPEGERSPSPEPIYNENGARINTREQRARDKLMRHRNVSADRGSA